MIKNIAEKLKQFFNTNEVEIKLPDEILLKSWILIKYTSDNKITFTDTIDFYNYTYETNLENLCDDIRKELWI